MGLSIPLPLAPRTRLRVRALSSSTNRLVLYILAKRPGVRFPEQHELLSLTPDGDRLEDSDEKIVPSDELWGFSLRDEPTGTLERGETYARVDLIPPGGGQVLLNLASGHVTTLQPLSMGMHEDAFSGHGNMIPEVVGEDIAGNVNTDHPLDLVNGIRRVDGLMLMYHCSGDTANRVLVIRIREKGPAYPTGFDAGNDRQIMAITGPTLIANQDGMMYWNNAGYQTSVVDSVNTLANNTTAPNPFPFWVSTVEGGAHVRFEITAGEAADTYNAYIFGETWFA